MENGLLLKKYQYIREKIALSRISLSANVARYGQSELVIYAVANPRAVVVHLKKIGIL
jgi:hypothetical protein